MLACTSHVHIHICILDTYIDGYVYTHAQKNLRHKSVLVGPQALRGSSVFSRNCASSSNVSELRRTRVWVLCRG